MKYDFDYLKNLYKENPDEFEEITTDMINKAINTSREENREKLRAKQWRLQQELSKYKDPVARMNIMVSIFWTGVNEFLEVTKKLKNVENLSDNPPKSCQVIDFIKKK